MPPPAPANPVPFAIERDAPIDTWFRIGGRADRLVRIRTEADLLRALETDQNVRILGDGANLLVDDDGVAELVAATKAFSNVAVDEAAATISAAAGADLPRLINTAVRAGLAGLEGLAGIPASIGGAIMMNAGGRFGEIKDAVAAVHVVDRAGRRRTLTRGEIDFSYRHSGLEGLIILGAEFQLQKAEREPLRANQVEVMRYKKESQPLAADSAGCVFKNPTLLRDLDGIAAAGARVSAGMLIDRAGCKGLTIGGASISERHGNFFVTTPGATARDVITLMEEASRRVSDAFGVTLEPEVVVWRRER